jgi:hypothetical protein
MLQVAQEQGPLTVQKQRLIKGSAPVPGGEGGDVVDRLPRPPQQEGPFLLLSPRRQEGEQLFGPHFLPAPVRVHHGDVGKAVQTGQGEMGAAGAHVQRSPWNGGEYAVSSDGDTTFTDPAAKHRVHVSGVRQGRHIDRF